MLILQQILNKASRQMPLLDQGAFNLSDSSISPSLFVSPVGWQNAFLPIATLLLQYIFESSQPAKTSTKPENLSSLRLENLPVLKY